MLISKIKDKYLRELAELRREESDCSYSNNLFFAFKWHGTKEGHDYWKDVNDGKITELPKKNYDLIEGSSGFENINNASQNAIEEIRVSYTLQDLAKESHYKLTEIKELHRAVNSLKEAKKIVEIAEKTGVSAFKVIEIVKELNK